MTFLHRARRNRSTIDAYCTAECLNRRIARLTVNSPKSQQISAFTGGEVIPALVSAIATVTIVGVGISLTMTLLSLRLGEQGFSAWAIGFNPAAGGLAILAGAAFAPALVRQMTVKPLLFLALLISSLCLMSFASTDNYWAWLAIRTLFSGALSVLFVTSEYWINAIAPPRNRGFVLGFYMTSLAGGFAVGPGILGFVGTAGATPFIVATALFVLAALPIVLWSGKVPGIRSEQPVPVLRFFTSLPEATLAGLLYGAIETASLGLLPVYALRTGLSPETGALFVTLFAFGNVLFQFPMGFASDMMDRSKLLLWLAILGLCGAFALAFLGLAQFALFCGLLVIWGGIVGSLYAVGLAHLGSRYSGPELVSANAAYVMLYSLGMLGGPLIAGFGMDLTPPSGLFFSLAGLILLYLALVSGQGHRWSIE